MSPFATPDGDYFQLSSGELHVMTDRIEQIMDILINSVAALEVITKNILSIGSQGMPIPNEIKEIFDLADILADQADNSHVLLAEVIQAIEDRCERDLQNFLASLGEKA